MRYLFVIFFISFTSIGQSKMVKGFVLDDTTKQPIPFVNLSIIDSRKGTSSDHNGSFRLEIEENDLSKNIYLSSLGFKDSIFAVSQLVKENRIFLRAKTEVLSEVVISKKFEEQLLVVNPIIKKDIKSGFGASEYPIILALYFPYEANYDATKNLNSVKIYLKQYWFEKNRPSKFRLRLLSVGKDELPDEDLVYESIVVETEKNQKEVIIDVSKYNLTFSENGLYIGLEWLFIPFNEYEETFTAEGENRKKTMKRFAPKFALTMEEIEKYKVMVFLTGQWYDNPMPSIKDGTQIVPAISLTLSN